MIGVRYTSTAQGEAPKFVTCKKCGHGYGYWMTRHGSGSNTSWFLIGRDAAQNRSGRDAEAEVARRLRTEHDPVPCPECGHYQKKMIEPAREERYRWLVGAGIGFGLIAGFGIIGLGMILTLFGDRDGWAGRLKNSVMAMACPATIGIPVAAVGLKSALAWRYNPNADPVEDRIDRGRERAMSPKEYVRLAPPTGPQLPPTP